ncbi:MAG: PPOX class F420-dependent oxidoreductase [Chloroflexaceae bacterium]|nr:PPOX class F420-dependent oxidoreductase [Chloroflexaceae bacterium]NJO07015.1 PPOX class F420-dependent oxidoreductase [Chloroflexaceae bacterium]
MTHDASAFPTLAGHQYMNLITFRKTGVPVATPVWFAEYRGHLYVVSQSTTGKVKRIRNNARVQVEPSDAQGTSLGPAVPAYAELLPRDADAVANVALQRKYGILYGLFAALWYCQGNMANIIYLAIRPANYVPATGTDE